MHHVSGHPLEVHVHTRVLARDSLRIIVPGSHAAKQGLLRTVVPAPHAQLPWLTPLYWLALFIRLTPLNNHAVAGTGVWRS